VVAHSPSDVYLQYIVRLQKLLESADDVLRQATDPERDGRDNIVAIHAELDSFKSSLSFPFDCCELPLILVVVDPKLNFLAILSLQVNFLELLLGQMTLPGFPFGNKKMEVAIVYNAQLADNLTAVVSASRSLVSFLLSMTPGKSLLSQIWPG